MCLGCSLDLDKDGDGHIDYTGPPSENKCLYNDVDYSVGTIHPGDSCLWCIYVGSQEREWVNRGDGACVDGVFHKGYAYIGGVLYPSGTINPDNECEISSNGYYWRKRPGCCIDGIFYSDGSKNPNNPCEWCVCEGCFSVFEPTHQVNYWSSRGPLYPCPEGRCDGEGNCN